MIMQSFSSELQHLYISPFCIFCFIDFVGGGAWRITSCCGLEPNVCGQSWRCGKKQKIKLRRKKTQVQRQESCWIRSSGGVLAVPSRPLIYVHLFVTPPLLSMWAPRLECQGARGGTPEVSQHPFILHCFFCTTTTCGRLDCLCLACWWVGRIQLCHQHTFVCLTAKGKGGYTNKLFRQTFVIFWGHFYQKFSFIWYPTLSNKN